MDTEITKSNIHSSAIVLKGARIRNSVLSKNVSVGGGARIDHSYLPDYVRVDRMNHLTHVNFGRHTYTGANTVIMHTDIGAFSSVSWGVTIGGGEHDHSRISQHCFIYNDYDEIRPQDITIPYNRFRPKCKIGNDVWVASNATILRGVTVGDGAVIGANALVCQDIPPYAIVGGVPAKLLKFRFEDDIIAFLLKIKWWRWSDQKIKKNYTLLSNVPDIDVLKNIAERDNTIAKKKASNAK